MEGIRQIRSRARLSERAKGSRILIPGRVESSPFWDSSSRISDGDVSKAPFIPSDPLDNE